MRSYRSKTCRPVAFKHVRDEYRSQAESWSGEGPSEPAHSPAVCLEEIIVQEVEAVDSPNRLMWTRTWKWGEEFQKAQVGKRKQHELWYRKSVRV